MLYKIRNGMDEMYENHFLLILILAMGNFIALTSRCYILRCNLKISFFITFITHTQFFKFLLNFYNCFKFYLIFESSILSDYYLETNCIRYVSATMQVQD